MAATYTLPCSPKVLCEDRFSILDTNEPQVPFWQLLQELLRSDIANAAQIIEILETIAVTLRQKSNTDYGSLRTFMRTNLSPTFFTKTWPLLVDLALQMPKLFPEHTLPILSPSQPSLKLSREQTACLVIHQFLCTLTAPTWQDGFQDFHIWYSSEQPHSGAVEAYLTALFTYFERLASSNEYSPLAFDVEDWSIMYTLVNNCSASKHACEYLPPLEVLYLPIASTAPDVLGLPDGASVISANRFIGFGRTGTQEETHVGASPECCPAVLVTPPLKNDQVMVATGPEAMITISGYGRDARCTEILRPSPTGHKARWARRTMLFMDALELDLADREEGLPDVAPGNVRRELKKAFIAFRSGQTDGSEDDNIFSVVYTGYWGCRTFGGNSAIKTMVQWCAAALAGCQLKFVCSGEQQHEIGRKLKVFVQEVRDLNVSPDQLESVLYGLSTSDFAFESDPLKVVLKLLKEVESEL